MHLRHVTSPTQAMPIFYERLHHVERWQVLIAYVFFLLLFVRGWVLRWPWYTSWLWKRHFFIGFQHVSTIQGAGFCHPQYHIFSFFLHCFSFFFSFISLLNPTDLTLHRSMASKFLNEYVHNLVWLLSFRGTLPHCWHRSHHALAMWARGLAPGQCPACHVLLRSWIFTCLWNPRINQWIPLISHKSHALKPQIPLNAPV